MSSLEIIINYLLFCQRPYLYEAIEQLQVVKMENVLFTKDFYSTNRMLQEYAMKNTKDGHGFNVLKVPVKIESEENNKDIIDFVTDKSIEISFDDFYTRKEWATREKNDESLEVENLYNEYKDIYDFIVENLDKKMYLNYLGKKKDGCSLEEFVIKNIESLSLVSQKIVEKEVDVYPHDKMMSFLIPIHNLIEFSKSQAENNQL